MLSTGRAALHRPEDTSTLLCAPGVPRLRLGCLLGGSGGFWVLNGSRSPILVTRSSILCVLGWVYTASEGRVLPASWGGVLSGSLDSVSPGCSSEGPLMCLWRNLRPHRLLQQLRRLLEHSVLESAGFLRRHKHRSGLTGPWSKASGPRAHPLAFASSEPAWGRVGWGGGTLPWPPGQPTCRKDIEGCIQETCSQISRLLPTCRAPLNSSQP